MNETANYKVIKGSIPILVSAPHVHSHRRPSLTLSYKTGEPYTDNIVDNICLNTGAWGIFQTTESTYDPSYHKLESNPYKQEIEKIVGENKIKLFLDIHGLSDEHDYDLGIYYPSKFTNSIKLADNISKAIDRKNLKDLNICILRFKDDEQETLGEFVASKLRVPSIQLEVARYIREKDLLRNSLIENISEFLRM
jgi:hypothetical protein